MPFLPSASDPFGRQGFVRVANRSAEAGEVAIAAYETVTLAFGTGETRHFNSNDLELGNPGKGLVGSTGSGEGDWRLKLASDLDVARLRPHAGRFPDAHVRRRADAFCIAIFNPGSNRNQVSSLRLVKPGDVDAAVTVAGIDGGGESPGGAVTLVVPARAVRFLGAAELESGGDGFEGALRDGRASGACGPSRTNRSWR